MVKVILVNCKNCNNLQQTLFDQFDRGKGKTKCVHCGKTINKKEQLVRVVR